MDEKYDIKWKTYSDHLLGVFKELLEEGNFADVTLVSDDQIQTPVHKVVLSACSPVLKTLLVNNPHSHPLLHLRGIKQTELQAILKYMYLGETQIFEDRINEFISVAKDLEIKEISKEQNIETAREIPVIEVRSQEQNISQVEEDTAQSTFVDGATGELLAQGEISAIHNPNSTISWPDPLFCSKCGHLCQGNFLLEWWWLVGGNKRLSLTTTIAGTNRSVLTKHLQKCTGTLNLELKDFTYIRY